MPETIFQRPCNAVKIRVCTEAGARPSTRHAGLRCSTIVDPHAARVGRTHEVLDPAYALDARMDVRIADVLQRIGVAAIGRIHREREACIEVRPRFEQPFRMPGADANPYLAFAAMLVAGLAGIDEGLDCGSEYRGNAYIDESLPALPTNLRDALNLFEHSELAKRSFGADVVEHYAHAGWLEVRAFDAAVTDWERQRYYERI